MNFSPEVPLKTSTCVDKKKCLIFTNSGGNGHLQSAKTLGDEIRAKFPDMEICQVDIFEDFFGPIIGKFFAERWNGVQRTGDVIMQAILIKAMSFAHWLFFMPIFVQTLYMLFKNDFTQIIDTQNISMKAIIRAVRVYNKWKGKHLLIERIITDLPTRDTSLYFPFIRALSRKDKEILRIKTTKPLLNGEKNDAEFWEKHCEIGMDKIEYTPLPIRPEFRKYAHELRKRETPLSLTLAFPDQTMHNEFLEIISFGSLQTTSKELFTSFTLQAEDTVSIIMLGANPNKAAILNYLRAYIHLVSRKNYKTRRDVVFVLCSKNPPNTISLQQRILELVKSHKNFPKNLTILPLPYQEDAIIAPLFYRSDLSLTKCGGITAMELLSVCHGRILIHRERPAPGTLKFFTKWPTVRFGMPPWELGNLRYLRSIKGAQIVTPETFGTICQNFFDEDAALTQHPAYN